MHTPTIVAQVMQCCLPLMNYLRSDLNWGIWRRFKEAGIEIPFPQQVVHWGPPANLTLDNP